MHTADHLAGTIVSDILSGMEKIYSDIEQKQSVWKQAGGPSCTEGCGQCCVSFEPDVLESEALYLAAWLIDNQPFKARQIAEGTFVSPRHDDAGGCFLFDPDSPWHCTVYEGRCMICRLFGYSGDYGKLGEKRFKPCRFLPQTELDKYHLEHRQYIENELIEQFGTLPPAMSDLMEQALSLTPGNEGSTTPLRDALPAAIKKLQWLILCNDNSSPDDGDQPQSA